MNRIWLALAAIVCLATAYLVADSLERSLLANTARLVLAVEAGALPIASVLAFLLVRTNLAGKSLALLLCSSLLFIPLYLQLCGWEAAFGRQGWHTFAFNTLQEPWLNHWRGAIVVHIVYAIPWATCLMAAAFAQDDRQYEETALLDGSSGQVLRCVTLPQLGGGILLAAVWIFVITAGEMTVTNIYLVPTYAEDVYNFYAGNADVLANAVHFVPLLFGTAALALSLLIVLPSPAPPGERGVYLWPLGAWRTIASGGVLFLFCVLAIFPLGNLVERLGEHVHDSGGQVIRGWSVVKALLVLRDTPLHFYREFLNTGALALSVTAIATSAAIPWAWSARKRPFVSGSGWLLSILGVALPGPIIGLAVIALLNHDLPILRELYDRSLCGPILAVLVRVWPFCFLALWWAMQTLDDEALDAAALDGANSRRQLWSIALPQCWPLIGATALAAFVVASGDVSASLLVLPPGPWETIARRMFGLIHVGADDQVARVAVVCWLGYVATAATALALMWRFPKRWVL
jgi:iron(III) transport system permease protein